MEKTYLMLGIALVVGVFGIARFKEQNKPESERTVANYLEQFQGKTVHWNPDGSPYRTGDGYWIRNFDINAKIYAVENLGNMGPAAAAAVPTLIEELRNGNNDIDTGDGILPYRSEIARALGKIGDSRAIGPLIEKLEVVEPPHQLNRHYQAQATGVGHESVIKALMRFGDQAKPALPALRELMKSPGSETRPWVIRNAIKRLDPDWASNE